MSDDVKIDVGDGEEVATEINLDAEPIKQEEEVIEVEQTTEETKTEETPKV
jgi:hypothetical protein